MEERRAGGDADTLAEILAAASPGRAPSHWQDLSDLQPRMLLVAGGQDEKYVRLVHRMREAIGGNSEVVVLEGSGHAVHVQRPEAVMRLVCDWQERNQ